VPSEPGALGCALGPLSELLHDEAAGDVVLLLATVAALVWGNAAGEGHEVVSLFIAQLAYDEPLTITMAKVGIFAGSLVSGVLGAAILAGRR
jgi:Na+/H+ antiporter NhaA